MRCCCGLAITGWPRRNPRGHAAVERAGGAAPAIARKLAARPTFAYCGGSAPAHGCFPNELARLGPLVAAAIVVLAIYLLLAAWAAYSPRPAFKIASYLTLTFRKPVKPASVLAVLNAALWLIRWMVVPVVLLPILSGIATQGWRGAAPRSRKPVYWVETPVLLVCALWIPLQPHGMGAARGRLRDGDVQFRGAPDRRLSALRGRLAGTDVPDLRRQPARNPIEHRSFNRSASPVTHRSGGLAVCRARPAASAVWRRPESAGSRAALRPAAGLPRNPASPSGPQRQARRGLRF